MGPLIENSAEILPLNFKEGNFFAINVTSILDVINYGESKFVRFKCSDKILAFQKYAFNLCDELISNNIFKIVDEPKRRAFVSESFVNTAVENDLKGFDFRLVWDSDE